MNSCNKRALGARRNELKYCSDYWYKDGNHEWSLRLIQCILYLKLKHFLHCMYFKRYYRVFIFQSAYFKLKLQLVYSIFLVAVFLVHVHVLV
jgi:hypothetical protein